MTPADLRYLDPATLSGEMQTRDILAQYRHPYVRLSTGWWTSSASRMSKQGRWRRNSTAP